MLETNDEAFLYKAKDPRTVVVDSIMSDLEFAAAHVSASMNGGTNTRVTKWTALTLLARVALYEGTFRKYHTELNLQNTADAFLQKAVSASETIMKTGSFAITGSGAAG